MSHKPAPPGKNLRPNLRQGGSPSGNAVSRIRNLTKILGQGSRPDRPSPAGKPFGSAIMKQ